MYDKLIYLLTGPKFDGDDPRNYLNLYSKGLEIVYQKIHVMTVTQFSNHFSYNTENEVFKTILKLVGSVLR